MKNEGLKPPRIWVVITPTNEGCGVPLVLDTGL